MATSCVEYFLARININFHLPVFDVYANYKILIVLAAEQGYLVRLLAINVKKESWIWCTDVVAWSIANNMSCKNRNSIIYR